MTVPSDDEVMQAIVSVLEALGPFADDARRSEKWRTARQLAREIEGRIRGTVGAERVEALLAARHLEDLEAVRRGETPTSPVRRAKRPDLTTTETLWGSTRHLGFVWNAFPADTRSDAPVGPVEVRSTAESARIFLSHCHADSDKARALAVALAELGIGSWLAELRIDQGEDIITTIREALHESDAMVALVTRRFLASLWCRTELHTVLAASYPSLLVLDGTDEELIALIDSRSRETDGAIGGVGANGGGSFAPDLLAGVGSELVRLGEYRSVEDYAARAQGFAWNLPAYLGGRPLLRFPGSPLEPALRTLRLEMRSGSAPGGPVEFLGQSRRAENPQGRERDQGRSTDALPEEG